VDKAPELHGDSIFSIPTLGNIFYYILTTHHEEEYPHLKPRLEVLACENNEESSKIGNCNLAENF